MQVEITASIKRVGGVTANVSRPGNVATSVTRIGGTGTTDYEDLENKPSVNGVELIGNKTTEDLLIDVGVTSVNGKNGDVTLTATDVGALPDTTPIPVVPSNVSAFVNDAGYISGINSTDVTTALGYTPYNATNPSGYVNSAQAASAAPVQSVNGQTGSVSLSIPTKTSQLTNDAGFINEKEAPVQTVNGLYGDVVLKAKDVGAMPDTATIPTATSQLRNDSGFITAATAPVRSVNGQTGAVTLSIPTVPSNVSAFTNDAGYVNASGAASAAPVQSVNGQTGAVSLTIPVVPSAVSAFTNDAGYLTLSTLPIYQGGVSP